MKRKTPGLRGSHGVVARGTASLCCLGLLTMLLVVAQGVARAATTASTSQGPLFGVHPAQQGGTTLPGGHFNFALVPGQRITDGIVFGESLQSHAEVPCVRCRPAHRDRWWTRTRTADRDDASGRRVDRHVDADGHRRRAQPGHRHIRGHGARSGHSRASISALSLLRLMSVSLLRGIRSRRVRH